MRALTFLLTLLLLSGTALRAQQTFVPETVEDVDGRFSRTIVQGDPTRSQFYTLRNGLTVILSRNSLEPRVMALFAVRAGSKHDPADNTGLAHYLEHMLFKGTDRFGTLDYAAEKVYLDRIDSLYALYGATADPARRKTLYRGIDSLSGIASRYAIANEYDKMMAAIGSNVTNAFTSFENTTYMENFPSNNLEKFLLIQRERFRNPVLRLFHTELEAVYEEKNISLDRGGDKVSESMFLSLFPRHPYGTQTTIGTVEHLKNPSLEAIRRYYDTYYVPNNMALILCGDLDPEATIALVERIFGDWEPRTVPAFSFTPDEPRASVEEITVKSPDEESVAIGFRMPSALSQDAVLADLVSAILYNGSSGLIDKNLVQRQKVLEGYGYNYLLQDHGVMYFGGRPLEGQSLAQVRDLLLGEVANLKRGDFDEDLIRATVNNLRVQRIAQQEEAMNMAFALHESFVIGKPWERFLAGIEEMARLTKADVTAFANRWFRDNYTVVYKLSGEDPATVKVEKPEITPVEVNRNDRSPFLLEVTGKSATPIAPVFLDFEKDIRKAELQPGLPVWGVQNLMNPRFELSMQWDMGERHERLLPLATRYLQLIGSATLSNEARNKALYGLAVSFGISAGDDRVTLSLSGLQENLAPALRIVEDLINDPKADREAFDRMIDAVLKERKDALLDKGAIFRGGLASYAAYGPRNPFNDILSEQELRQLTPEKLLEVIRSLPTYRHRLSYYGPREFNAFVKEVRPLHRTPATLKAPPAERSYEPMRVAENTIYFVHYDMVQAEVNLFRWDQPFDPALVPLATAFNEYYGGGMGSVVFQDIRESRALAYSARSSFSRPGRKDRPFSTSFYVGTQADKLPQAMAAIHSLLDTMPASEKLWEVARRSLRQGVETKRVTREYILYSYDGALRLGLDRDIRRDVYTQAETLTLEDIRRFHGERFAKKPWAVCLIGSRDKLDLEALKPYGKVVELSLKDLFGYE